MGGEGWDCICAVSWGAFTGKEKAYELNLGVLLLLISGWSGLLGLLSKLLRGVRGLSWVPETVML